MIDFIKYFFRIKKINFLLTFLSLLNFGIMFGVEEDKKKHKAEEDKKNPKIEIKFERKDGIEKKPFIMFLENFCQIFDLKMENIDIKDFRKSKYDFRFYYRDTGGEDKVLISTVDDFGIFYNYPDSYEDVSTTRHLFFEKKNNEEEGNEIVRAYDDIINKENFKNISITVYINEDLKVNNEEEKKEENNVNYKYMENDLDGNGDKKNNDCPCCPCCNCC